MKLYIDLFHGRKNLSEDMEDWGEIGPIIGPFNSVSITYLYHIRLNDSNDNAVYDMPIVEDCVLYDGIYYGDWCIFHEDFFISNPEAKARIESPKLNPFYDMTKPEVPKKRIMKVFPSVYSALLWFNEKNMVPDTIDTDTYLKTLGMILNEKSCFLNKDFFILIDPFNLLGE